MTIPKLAHVANDAIKLYREGASAASIAKQFGVTTTTVTSLLKKHGVMPALERGKCDQRIDADKTQILALFDKGFQPAKIATIVGRSKTCVYSLLNLHRKGLRGHLGGPLPDEQVRKVAMSRGVTGKMNRTEQHVNNILIEAGFQTDPQLAIDRYNVDIAIKSLSVAVEVNCRGSFAPYIRQGVFVNRIKQFAQLGWHTYILVSRDHQSVVERGTDDLIAWLYFMDRQKAPRRQYRMVRSPFELLATGCGDDPNLANILSPKNIIKATGGFYKS